MRSRLVLAFVPALTDDASDVSGKHSDVDVYVYDRVNHEVFLGHAKVTPDVFHGNSEAEGWYKLEARDPQEDLVSGEVHLKFSFQKTGKKQFGPNDFQVLRLIGKGLSRIFLIQFPN